MHEKELFAFEEQSEQGKDWRAKAQLTYPLFWGAFSGSPVPLGTSFLYVCYICITCLHHPKTIWGSPVPEKLIFSLSE